MPPIDSRSLRSVSDAIDIVRTMQAREHLREHCPWVTRASDLRTLAATNFETYVTFVGAVFYDETFVLSAIDGTVRIVHHGEYSFTLAESREHFTLHTLDLVCRIAALP